MDRHALFAKLKESLAARKKALLVVAGIAVVAGIVVGTVQLGPTVARGLQAEGGWSVAKTAHAYVEAFKSVQQKMAAIRQAEEENRVLKLENANLRLKTETLQFDCTLKAAAGHARGTALQLDGETGSRVGRSLASIQYRPPTHLLPPQLYTLGVSYFDAREDEKAAVIFTYLTGLEENDAFKTAKNYLVTGVSWYRLDNFQLADQYFERVLSSEVATENLQYQAQARLWRGLVAERLNKHANSQHWLRELIDHHPQSTEAVWVNSREARRAVATETD